MGTSLKPTLVMSPLKTLLLIGASIGLSVGVSWTLIQAHERSTHPGSALIRELRVTQEDVRELRAEMKALRQELGKLLASPHRAGGSPGRRG